MALVFRRIAGAVRQDGVLMPMNDGEAMPEDEPVTAVTGKPAQP